MLATGSIKTGEFDSGSLLGMRAGLVPADERDPIKYDELFFMAPHVNPRRPIGQTHLHHPENLFTICSQKYLTEYATLCVGAVAFIRSLVV